MEFQLVALTLLFGLVAGFFFGLTGNGGSTLAVPLLVYGLHLPPHRAVCTSMIAVGVMSAARTLSAWKSHTADLATGWRLGVASMIGAPVGAALGGMLAEEWLLLFFSGLACLAALRLWQQSTAQRVIPSETSRLASGFADVLALRSCRRNDLGSSVLRFGVIGFVTGILTGCLGVGGGFILVPALVLVGGLEIHRAVVAAMFSVALASTVGMASHLLAGQRVSPEATAFFTAGSLLGMPLGVLLAAKVSGRWLQRVIALMLAPLGVVIVLRSLAGR